MGEPDRRSSSSAMPSRDFSPGPTICVWDSPSLRKPVKPGQMRQPGIGDRGPAQVELRQAGHPRQVLQARIADLGRLELQLAKVLQIAQVAEQLIGHARRSQRNLLQPAVLDDRLAPDGPHPSGHGRVSLTGHVLVRPCGDGGPYRGIQERHVAPRHRGLQAFHAGAGHPGVTQIDRAQVLQVLEQRRHPRW